MSRILRAMPQRRSTTALRRVEEGEGTRTVVIALLSNVAIAVAKLIGGLLSGSTGLLAEAAHSAADTVNEICLAIGLCRDRRPADIAHPLGHGRERFLWSFMAAIASFLIGGCLSIAMAVAQLKGRHPVPGGLLAWIVLAISFVADGTSWLQSMRQARRQAKDYKLTAWRYIFRSSDPVVRAVFFEDSAALIGLFLAASGLLLSKIFGTSVPDSLASLVIGLLLASAAIGVARPFADFLVGRSVVPVILEEILAVVETDAAVEQVLTFRAIYSGPEEVLVMAKIHPAAHINSEQFSRAMDNLDHKIRLAFPFVADVFIDVTANHIQEALKSQ